MSDEGRAVIHRVFDELLNGRKLDVADEIIAADYVEHAPLPGQSSGPQGLKERLAMLQEGFPDYHYALEDAISDGGKAVARWTMTATHDGEFMGISPTGKHIEVSGIDIYRIANGHIAEHWHEMDTLSMLQQLGAIPTSA